MDGWVEAISLLKGSVEEFSCGFQQMDRITERNRKKPGLSEQEENRRKENG